MGAVLKLIRKGEEYPRDRETSRPYKLWASSEKKYVPHRNYKYRDRAVKAALWESYRLKIHQSLEVIDCRNGRLIATMTVKFVGGQAHIQCNEY